MTSPTSRTRGRLAAVWFADIVGYSALTAADHNRAFTAVECLEQLARRIVPEHGGRLVKFIGDAALAEFTSTAAAVQAAIDLQRAFAIEVARQRVDTTLRIGVHLGEIQAAPDGDLFGDGLNVASRLQAEAAPGGVLVSHDVWHSLRGNPDFEFMPAGKRRLRGIMRPITVYEAAWSDQPYQDTEYARASGWHALRPLFFGAAVAAVGAVLLLLAIDRAQSADGRAEADSTAQGELRIAVVPLDARQAGNDHEYLGAALAHDLLASLSQDVVEAVSRHAVDGIGAGPISPDSIARLLSADAVLHGAIVRAQDSVRLTLQLFVVTERKTFRTPAASFPAHDVRAIREGGIQAGAALLRAGYGRGVLSPARPEEPDIAAWALTHRAEHLIHEVRAVHDTGEALTASDALQHADELLTSAVAMSPGWIEPVLLRGYLAYALAQEARASDEAAQWIERGLEHADAALRRDRSNPDALELRGRLRLLHHDLGLTVGRFDRTIILAAAGRDLVDAVRSDTTSASALSALSRYFEATDSLAAAAESAARAYELDPWLPDAADGLAVLFNTRFALRQYEAAREWCTTGATRFPGDYRFSACDLILMLAPTTTADPDRAWGTLDRVKRLADEHQREYQGVRGEYLLGGILTRAGLTDSARSVLMRARSHAALLPENKQHFLAYEAVMRSLAGDNAEAFRLLREANRQEAWTPVAEDAWAAHMLRRRILTIWEAHGGASTP